MFSGLMSRCTTPASCAADNAEATCTANFQCVAHIHPSARQQRAQSYTFDELSRNEVSPSFYADLVNGQNVRMIQGRRVARLGFEAAQLRLVLRQMLWEKLKRDLTPEPLVSRQIDFAHPAHTEQRFDPVVTDRLTDQIARRLVNQKFGGNGKAGDLIKSPDRS